jgi:hypothetical protein
MNEYINFNFHFSDTSDDMAKFTAVVTFVQNEI